MSGNIRPDARDPTTMRVQSRSAPGTWHHVRHAGTPEPTCDCPGFTFRRNCAHVQAVLDAAPARKEEPRMDPDPESGPRLAVTMNRKVNIGNYESVDIFVGVSNVPPGTPLAEIEQLLAEGEYIFAAIERDILAKVATYQPQRR